MSLTGFNRLRRMQQVEEMKPENIQPKEEVKEEIIEPVIEEIKEEKVEEIKEEPVEEEKPATTARRRTTRKK